ncbi:GxxExxY protein [Candidatus Pacearchaeota archaeon]|nr:GxxExxY protein [Candidatus Pacearchaeota archaeon]
MNDKIKKIAEDVFETLGSGYSEEVYEKAMEVGLRLAKIPYENQRVLPIFYKNFAVGTSKPDLIVKDTDGGEKIILELKATPTQTGMKEEVQLQKYLQNLKMKKGIIINFPQTNKDGPGIEIEFKVVSDQLNKCDKCDKVICHGAECGVCAKKDAKKSKE